MNDELFEAMWEHTEHAIVLRYRDRPVDEQTDDGWRSIAAKLKRLLREVMDSVRVPEHIDLVAFWAPVNMMVRGDEHQPTVVETQNVCVTEGDVFYPGPIVEGIERILGTVEGDHTIGIYMLPLPHAPSEDGRLWAMRWAKREGHGWTVMPMRRIPKGELIAIIKADEALTKGS